MRTIVTRRIDTPAPGTMPRPAELGARVHAVVRAGVRSDVRSQALARRNPTPAPPTVRDTVFCYMESVTAAAHNRDVATPRPGPVYIEANTTPIRVVQAYQDLILTLGEVCKLLDNFRETGAKIANPIQETSAGRYHARQYARTSPELAPRQSAPAPRAPDYAAPRAPEPQTYRARADRGAPPEYAADSAPHGWNPPETCTMIIRHALSGRTGSINTGKRK